MEMKLKIIWKRIKITMIMIILILKKKKTKKLVKKAPWIS